MVWRGFRQLIFLLQKKDPPRKWISLYFDFVNPLLAALDGFRLLVSGFILVLALDFDI